MSSEMNDTLEPFKPVIGVMASLELDRIHTILSDIGIILTIVYTIYKLYIETKKQQEK